MKAPAKYQTKFGIHDKVAHILDTGKAEGGIEIGMVLSVTFRENGYVEYGVCWAPNSIGIHTEGELEFPPA